MAANHEHTRLTRRQALLECGTAAGAVAVGAAGLATLAAQSAAAAEKQPAEALVAITLDLEMARNFPAWEDTEWDYEKGNLTPPVKQYAVDACRRVKDRGGVIHTFVVGQVFEQPDIAWLQEIADTGHPIGNHTYDHVYLLAKNQAEVQYRFARAPWLLRGRSIPEVLRENIALCNKALKQRIGVDAAGFRTPGGFANGLHDREDVQNILLDLGFDWVSAKYPAHAGIEPLNDPDRRPSQEALDNIVAAQQAAQPFAYPTGLIDVPMSPISDIGAFRNGRWQLDDFLYAIRIAMEWVLENNAVFDFLAHPSCLGVVDPNFRAIDLICDLVEQANGQARIVGLDALAERART